ncbi:MAG: hypothetical protein K2H18_01280 [Muribaculaceae bacterium]|nr:hypothetical protein [Muribaculaceae bacterium]
MKKLKGFILGVLGVAAFFTSLNAQAQKGEKSLGLIGGFSTYNNGGYMGVDFQYTIIDHVRIAPDIAYSFRNDQKSAFIMDVDVHFPFKLAKGFDVYPLVGFAFNNWSYEGGGSASRAGGNFGGGFDFYMTSNLKLSLQGKYSVMNDTSGGFIGMGIGYVF